MPAVRVSSRRRFKATFFIALGYSVDAWEVLATDLRHHASSQDATLAARTSYGQKYEVRGILEGPSGRTAFLVTGWIVRVGERHPRYVSAYPGPKS